MADFYRRKQRGIGGKKAIIALARKILILAWRLWLEDREAREAHAVAYARKLRSLEKAAAPYPYVSILADLLTKPDGEARAGRRAAA